MPTSTPPFKADVVGSLLRPQTIHDARARLRPLLEHLQADALAVEKGAHGGRAA